MMLKNRNIGTKLTTTFILIAMISSLGGIVGLSVMGKVDSSYRYALANYGFSQGDVGRFNAEFNSSRALLNQSILADDQQDIHKICTELDQANENADTYLSVMQKSMVNQAELSYCKNIKDNYAKFIDIEKQVVNLAKQNKDNEAVVVIQEGSRQIDKVQFNINALLKLKTETGNQLAAGLSKQETTAKIIILLAILIAFGISLLIAVAISRSISKPVKEMADAAQKMAQGDLSVKITVDSDDEIGRLGKAFSQSIHSMKSYMMDISRVLGEMERGNLTVETEMEYKGDFENLKESCDGILLSFNRMISRILAAAEQVDAGSGQLSNSAQTLAQGAATQADSAEQLACAIQEMSTQIKQNARYSADASDTVCHVRSEIQASNQQMEGMLSAMSQIDRSSGQIEKIIQTIEGIAFQTNILALNAAVEAARAGNAGKGFAVVADEVRNLADKSTRAAKETTALIKNSIDQVKCGTKIANETAESLLQVVESIQKVSNTVENISLASKKQEDSVDRVTVGIDRISGVVQTNSATAEQSAAASEELAGQALILKSLVRQFMLQDSKDTPEESSAGQTEETRQQDEGTPVPSAV